MKTNNILVIYEHIYKASNEIKGESIDYNRGFQDAVYMISYALKGFEHINLHLENKSLSERLKKVESDLGVYLDDKNVVYKTNKTLKQKLETVTNQLNSFSQKRQAEIKKNVNGNRLNKVEIDFEGQLINFDINANKETFDSLFDDAVIYVYKLRDKKTKKKSLTIIKNWFMQFYRNNGFVCVS